MRAMVRREGGQCVLYRLVPVLLGSLWLLGGGVSGAQGVVFWTDETPEFIKPSARNGHGLAYDMARGKVVLFGGCTEWDCPQTPLQDTWEWDGAAGTWQPVNLLGLKPPGRWGFAMAYDTARGQTVLFGGSASSTDYRDDTWVWDGETWRPVNLFGDRPPARHWHAMAYDRARGKIVLFGGRDRAQNFLQDTWEWDGSRWRDVSPTVNNPSRRYYHALAYDAARRQTVLFGGFDASRGIPVQDTWVWDGVAWTEVNLAPTGTKPDARCNHAMVYDPTRERVVLFGGETPAALQDTWEWNGTTWARVLPTGDLPAARFAHAMAYDAAHDTLVLFGGTPWISGNSFQDTWLYDDNNAVRQGYWTINECRGLPDGTTEPCYWHYRYDTQRCTSAQPCSKLVVFFSTGLQLCDEPQTFTADTGKGKLLQAYAVDDRYVAVCANTFLTAAGPGSVSFNAERDRVDVLMRNITDPSRTQSSVIRSVWDGQHLLWSGVSHGATAPVIAMARTTFDSDPERPWWRGSAFTGACFYDGVYNQIDLDLFLAENSCTAPPQDLHKRLIEQRYYPDDADGFDHACDNQQCPCAPGHRPEIDEDTITGGVSPAAASDFAIADWKLIECGSGALTPEEKCRDDVLPRKTIEDLCNLLGPSRCTFGSRSDESHDQCAQSLKGIPQCRLWFNAKVRP